ncbi:hypothetical protein DL767_007563 [Monosporascus sp. MG133]|nr:hypothetical protein DL767_007563 [Monosporascus sp. MG133]
MAESADLCNDAGRRIEHISATRKSADATSRITSPSGWLRYSRILVTRPEERASLVVITNDTERDAFEDAPLSFEIAGLYSRPEAHGRGLGSALMNVAVERPVKEARPQGKHLELKSGMGPERVAELHMYFQPPKVELAQRNLLSVFVTCTNGVYNARGLVTLDASPNCHPRNLRLSHRAIATVGFGEDPGYGGNLVPWPHKDNNNHEGDRRDGGDRDDDDDDDDRQDDDPRGVGDHTGNIIRYEFHHKLTLWSDTAPRIPVVIGGQALRPRNINYLFAILSDIQPEGNRTSARLAQAPGKEHVGSNRKQGFTFPSASTFMPTYPSTHNQTPALRGNTSVHDPSLRAPRARAPVDPHGQDRTHAAGPGAEDPCATDPSRVCARDAAAGLEVGNDAGSRAGGRGGSGARGRWCGTLSTVFIFEVLGAKL